MNIKMTPKVMFFTMLGILAGVLLLGGGGFYLIDQKLTTQSLEISNIKADQQIVSEQVAIYEDSKVKVEEFAFISELAEKVLPSSKNQAVIIAEINKFADDLGIGIQQLNFASGDPGITDPNVSQTTAVQGLPGVRAVAASIQLSPGIQYDKFISFLEKIEQNQRKMQVTSVSVSPDNNNRDALASASIEVSIFVKAN